MFVEVNSIATAGQTPEAALAAIPVTPPERDWTLLIGRSQSDFVRAVHTGNGNFELSFQAAKDLRKADLPVTADSLRSIVSKYLSGDNSWRSNHKWVNPQVAKSRSPAPFKFEDPFPSMGTPRWMTRLSIVAVVFAIVLPFAWPFLPKPQFGFFDIPLPAAIDSEAARIIMGFMLVVTAVFVFAVIVKGYETRSAGKWATTTGKIIHSSEGFENKFQMDHSIPVSTRVPKIEYEYFAGGVRRTATRISLAEIIGDDEIPGILARYPEGKSVSVHYNPNAPHEALLERGTPPGIAKGCLYIALFGILGTLALMWLVTNGWKIISGQLPNSIPPLMAIAGIAGLVFTASAVSIFRSTSKARFFPRATATIKRAEIVEFVSGVRRNATITGRSVQQKAWKPVVEYSFETNGRQHVSRGIWLDREDAGSKAFAQSVIDRYPVGSYHQAFVDPLNPKRSALEIKGGALIWLLLAVGLGSLFVAYVATGLNPALVFWTQPAG